MTTTIRPEWLMERDGKKALLYKGLLHLTHEAGLVEIATTLIQIPNETNGNVAICQACVTLNDGDGVLRRYQAIGDASPSNVTRMVANALIRMAETRAKARAMRDAINVGEALADDETSAVDTEQGEPTVAGSNGKATMPASGPSIEVARGEWLGYHEQALALKIPHAVPKRSDGPSAFVDAAEDLKQRIAQHQQRAAN